jgi:catechol 2,3-dioxygenase-like lactoylglutathione lyase family enzyme
MEVRSLDHVNVRTGDVERLVEWYGRVLGLHPGPRPDFDFPGAWLYAGAAPVIHLVGVGRTADPGPDLRLEHFALGATGLGQFLAHLDAESVPYRIGRLPGVDYGEVQVNLHDPDGNHIHVDFLAAEAEGLAF